MVMKLYSISAVGLFRCGCIKNKIKAGLWGEIPEPEEIENSGSETQKSSK